MSFKQIYKDAAEGLSATFHSFSQSRLLASRPLDDPSRRGICRALCLYEAHYAKGNRSREFKRDMPGLVDKICSLQENISVQNSTTLSEAFAELYEKQAQNLGLTYIAQSHFVPDVYNWLQGAAGYATRNPFYVQMVLPNHVVSVRPGAHGGVSFFDPNVGQISCPRAELFFLLHTIFNNPEISDAYQLTGAPEVFLVYLA
ncbi:hypothetical protein [Pseudomonas sp. NPDC087639]|uniref:hypothetical protein n=1 Tax=Pseudomonas sp. NPDC087639 TaxID=3364445 RepID=UPI00380E2EE5